MLTSRHRFSPTLAGIIAGLVIALFVGTLISIDADYGAPWASTHTLHLSVSDADALTAGSDVRIAGHLAGQVTDVQAAGDHAIVTVSVVSEDWPLAGDTTASVRLATLLGQKYIELDPGSGAGSLADGATLGVAATKPVVDFDQWLDTFNKPTRDSVTSLVTTLGTPGSGALAGQEDTIQALIPALSNLNVQSQTPTGELAMRDPQLNSILTDLATTGDALAASRTDLAATIDNLNRVTAALAANQGTALRSFIRNTDTINQTTVAVLGGVSASRLNAGLKQLPAVTAQLDTLLTKLSPEAATFYSRSYTASLDLILEIGDATSQGDQGGFFLRQNMAGVDLSGLTPPEATSAPPPQTAGGSSGPSLPGIHPGPLPSLPPLPTLPPLPGVCPTLLPGLTTPTPAPSPTPNPNPACPTLLPGLTTTTAPAPSPTPICVLSVCLGSYYYNGGAAPASIQDLTWWVDP